ncbi:RHS repeat-associated core domain-containing protein [Brevibacillus laterosporus]|uniref:RHS repeat-associated core domain-containing protein n=1 Tax=Brevibacillus laterosporus TaxID=1465 RepID=UPI0015E20DAE|nr:RHS repeat-associated core domain-containing protein [Brevibacillus laterosporus]
MLNPFLYAGELYDEESGLIYLRARYYDPNDGRFITEDTYKGQVDNPLSLNRYTYVHNNSVSNVDPTGNWCESKDGRWAHPGGCSSKSSKKSHDNDHSGDFIIENGKVIEAFKYDDGSGARELEGFEDPFTYITGVGGLLKGAIKAGAKKASQEATATFIKMDLQFFSKINLSIKPAVSNKKLQNIVNELYKGQNMPKLIGNGTTMDAIRFELKAGIPVGGKFHSQKGQDYSRALEKLVNNNTLNHQEKQIAQALLNDLRNALAGK